MKYLEDSGIGTAIHYPKPIHLEPSFKYLGYKKNYLPQAEKTAREVLSFLIYPELKRKEQDFIIREIKKFYEKKD